MSTDNLQDLINIMIYEDEDNVLQVEIYFKGRSSAFATVNCGDLLGELLDFQITINHENGLSDEDGVVVVKINKDSADQKDKPSKIMQNVLAPYLTLKDLFIDETFSIWDSYTSYNFLHYFNLCEKHKLNISYSTFLSFLQAYEIPKKSFTSFRHHGKSTKDHNMLLYKLLNSPETSEQLFMELARDNNHKEAFFYEDCQYTDFLYCLTYHILISGKKLKKCAFCHKYFVPVKADEKYCRRLKWATKNLDGKDVYGLSDDCKTLAAKQKRAEREFNNNVIKKENAVRTKLAKRTKSKTIPHEEVGKREKEYMDFMDEKDKKKKLLQIGELTESEYLTWLSEF